MNSTCVRGLLLILAAAACISARASAVDGDTVPAEDGVDSIPVVGMPGNLRVVEGTLFETMVAVAWDAPATGVEGGGADAYDLRFSTNQITLANFATTADTYSAEPTPGDPGTVEQASLTGMSEGTLYWVGVRASSGPSWGEPAIISFTMMTDTSPPTTIVLDEPEVESGDVLLTFAAPKDDATGPGAALAALSYDLRYSSLPITAGNWSDDNLSLTRHVGEPIPQLPGWEEGIVVSGLGPGTYYFAIKSVDNMGKPSLLSAAVTATVTAPPPGSGGGGDGDEGTSGCGGTASPSIAFAALLGLVLSMVSFRNW